MTEDVIPNLKKGKGEATDGLAHTGRATGARALTSTLPCGHVAPRMG